MIIINSKKVSTAHTEMRPRRRNHTKNPHKKIIIKNTNKKTTKNDNKQQQKNKQSLDGTHGDAAKKEKETKQKLTTDTHFPLFK